MKLRIRANTVRLRLNQQEVEALYMHDFIENSTFFLDNTFVYRLEKKAGTGFEASFAQGVICIKVNEKILLNWASSAEVGISAQIEGKQPIDLLIEKDFQCLAPRNPEEDLHAFPHPNTDKKC